MGFTYGLSSVLVGLGFRVFGFRAHIRATKCFGAVRVYRVFRVEG